MNFLEQLTAEWYAYNGYFVRTNIKFGKRAKGGWTGEMDVVAVRPQSQELVHVETSMDAHAWSKRQSIFVRKFRDAAPHYPRVAGFTPVKLERIAVVSLSQPKTPVSFGNGIDVRLIPDFIADIEAVLQDKHPLREAVEEGYMLLRAIQFAAYSTKWRKARI